MAGALFEEFGHERKKLEEIRGQIVEEDEVESNDSSNESKIELERCLQSILLWSFSQTNKFPGVRHVPRCQKLIKDLSIGVSFVQFNFKGSYRRYSHSKNYYGSFRIRKWSKWHKIQKKMMLD